jgi:hypothetical protein
VVTEEVTSDLVKDTVEGGRRLFLSLEEANRTSVSLSIILIREWKEGVRGNGEDAREWRGCRECAENVHTQSMVIQLSLVSLRRGSWRS